MLLNGGKKKLMIVGFNIVAESKKNKIWDFAGCPFPEGLLSSDQIFLFDKNNIKEVCYLGLKDEEEDHFENIKRKILNVTEGIKDE